jgi:hypothetical protein
VGCGTIFREISAQPPLLSINHLFLLDFSLQNPPGFINYLLTTNFTVGKLEGLAMNEHDFEIAQRLPLVAMKIWPHFHI